MPRKGTPHLKIIGISHHRRMAALLAISIFLLMAASVDARIDAESKVFVNW